MMDIQNGEKQNLLSWMRGNESLNIKTKSKFMQLFCKHDYQCFEKPLDKKANSYGFVSLNNSYIRVCLKCGKEEKNP